MNFDVRVIRETLSVKSKGQNDAVGDLQESSKCWSHSWKTHNPEFCPFAWPWQQLDRLNSNKLENRQWVIAQMKDSVSKIRETKGGCLWHFDQTYLFACSWQGKQHHSRQSPTFSRRNTGPWCCPCATRWTMSGPGASCLPHWSARSRLFSLSRPLPF